MISPIQKFVKGLSGGSEVENVSMESQDEKSARCNTRVNKTPRHLLDATLWTREEPRTIDGRAPVASSRDSLDALIATRETRFRRPNCIPPPPVPSAWTWAAP